MIKLAFDENADRRVLYGLLLRIPDLDVKRVQDVGLAGVDDPGVLEWAADEGRVVISFDKRTLTNFANERVTSGLHMPGVLILRNNVGIGTLIEELVLIVETSSDDEWNNRVDYIPL